MSHSGGISYVMTCGDKTYYRSVKKASDALEKSFRLAAMGAEATRAGIKQNEVRSGKIQQKDKVPTGAIEV